MKKFTKCEGQETTSVSWDRPASDITNFHPNHSSFNFLLRMWLWDQLTFVLQRRNRAINSFLLLLSFRLCKEALTGTKSRVRLVTRKCNSFPEPVGYLCICTYRFVHEQIFVCFVYLILSVRFTFVGKWRLLILIIVQRDATQSSLFTILQAHCTCFGCQPHPSSGVNKTVTTAFGTGQLPPSTVAIMATVEGGSWPVPKAVVTVLCTPDDGCGWHPKHAEWTCRIINRLLCVASRWTTINIDQRCTEP